MKISLYIFYTIHIHNTAEDLSILISNDISDQRTSSRLLSILAAESGKFSFR